MHERTGQRSSFVALAAPQGRTSKIALLSISYVTAFWQPHCISNPFHGTCTHVLLAHTSHTHRVQARSCWMPVRADVKQAANNSKHVLLHCHMFPEKVGRELPPVCAPYMRAHAGEGNSVFIT